MLARMDLSGLDKAVSQLFPEFWLGTLASAAFGAFAGAWINNRIANLRPQNSPRAHVARRLARRRDRDDIE
jgi:hypothetical protein